MRMRYRFYVQALEREFNRSLCQLMKNFMAELEEKRNPKTLVEILGNEGCVETLDLDEGKFHPRSEGNRLQGGRKWYTFPFD